MRRLEQQSASIEAMRMPTEVMKMPTNEQWLGLGSGAAAAAAETARSLGLERLVAQGLEQVERGSLDFSAAVEAARASAAEVERARAALQKAAAAVQSGIRRDQESK